MLLIKSTALYLLYISQDPSLCDTLPLACCAGCRMCSSSAVRTSPSSLCPRARACGSPSCKSRPRLSASRLLLPKPCSRLLVQIVPAGTCMRMDAEQSVRPSVACTLCPLCRHGNDDISGGPREEHRQDVDKYEQQHSCQGVTRIQAGGIKSQQLPGLPTGSTGVCLKAVSKA